MHERSLTAQMTIDRRRTGAEVDPRIYGGFLEHLGRCVYGGIFDEGSQLSDERGFRLDVLEALRALHIPVLRWPGGNFVSGYDWRDGIGPLDRRPRRWDAAWQAEESNRFGTDEFMAYCQALGAEPYLCVNMGTGDLREAAAWLEYCNGSGRTAWADLRRANGHPEPYGVKYWGLGNEVYGPWQIGAQSARDYTAKAREWAKVLRWTDPSAQLVACGDHGWDDWDGQVLEGLLGFVDWYSVHLYTGSRSYLSNVSQPHAVERALRILRASIERICYSRGIERPCFVAYDEWNQWYRADEVGNSHETSYNLADAIAVGVYLNGFLRNADIVRMANLAQMVNVIAPIVTNKSGLFLQTIYHPLRLYSEHMRGRVIDSFVSGPTYDLPADPSGRQDVLDLSPFSYLDTSAVQRAHDEIALAVVNRHSSDDIDATVTMLGISEGFEVCEQVVAGPDVDSVNSFDDPCCVSVAERRWGGTGREFQHRFPAHSISVLRVRNT